MLTPQEVADKKFGKSFMGGYDMTAVDDFLEVLTEDYASLFKENALLKNKIRVLVDKLEEYRSVDESMRKTWREAQKNADEMMTQAKRDAGKLLADAQSQADAQVEELNRRLETEEFRLNTARQQTVTFVNSLREIYQRQIEQLSVIPTIDIPPQTARQTLEDAASQAVFEIEQSVMAQIEGDYDDHAAEPREKDSSLSGQPEFAPPEAPEAVEPAAAIGVNIINTREGGFYGPDGNALDDDVIKLLWDPEKDTEVPRPRQDGFPDLEEQFGSGVEIVKKK
ncbi:MAG: DivIVA domain-containing protein [Oscillospiraceae bacterium]|nr:DivIVA domain-containing protein [Oscillospiraceae bacterium]